MEEFVTLENVSASIIFPYFGWLVLLALSEKRIHLFSWKL